MIEALDVLLAAFVWWILAGAAVLTIAALTAAAAVTWAWRALRKRPTGPSWAHGPLSAR
ncbi:hypothetical protein [Streptomyces aureocirculatus]|uniref:hypothetical protein n=1 Tax=Streptomyces aureocirculatus TaxID=67275 RepID=UPI000A496D9D|nr:hypothetical protein [Streptomyces aureocirculatus]